jgi:hypothetical protein
MNPTSYYPHPSACPRCQSSWVPEYPDFPSSSALICLNCPKAVDGNNWLYIYRERISLRTNLWRIKYYKDNWFHITKATSPWQLIFSLKLETNIDFISLSNN